MNEYTMQNTTNGTRESVEVYFETIPAKETRDALKAHGFRWHGVKRCWYGYADEATTAAIIDGAEAATGSDTKKERPATVTQQNHIRIYWNGLKVDGGKLTRCCYAFDTDREEVRIYARDYADLPRDLFEVKNDTDLYADYFDEDRATVGKTHPLYKYILYAAMKAQARADRPYCEKIREELRGREMWQGRFDYLRADLARREAFLAEFDKMTDPGQPTAEDLAAIDRQAQERENARKAAELAEEHRQREAVLNLRVNGRRLIEAEQTAHPVKDGAPVVIIEWSEHPAFTDYEDGSLTLSVQAAETILKALDKEQHETRDTAHGVGWYFKTAFRVEWVDESGERSTYSGRYDLGDGDGGLISHIAALAEWDRVHEFNGREKENPEPETERTRFAVWLAGQLETGSAAD